MADHVTVACDSDLTVSGMGHMSQATFSGSILSLWAGYKPPLPSPPLPSPPSYLNAIQTTCPHLLRYLTAAVVISKRRQTVLKDLVRWGCQGDEPGDLGCHGNDNASVPYDDGFCWNYRLMTSRDVTIAAYTEGPTHCLTHCPSPQTSPQTKLVS